MAIIWFALSILVFTALARLVVHNSTSHVVRSQLPGEGAVLLVLWLHSQEHIRPLTQALSLTSMAVEWVLIPRLVLRCGRAKIAKSSG